MAESEVSPKLDEYLNSDDMSSFPELIKSRIISFQDLKKIIEIFGKGLYNM